MMNSNEMLILFSLYITLLLEKNLKKNPNSFRQLKYEQCQSSPSVRFVTGDSHSFLS